MITKLLYLEDMYKLESQAKILDLIEQNNIYSIILDQTVFYPQGGGQPSDKGTITDGKTIFDVESVCKKDGIVYHSGKFISGFFAKNTTVKLQVDAALRHLHNRNHTAGHIIDYALHDLNYSLKPAKGYHFPNGPYVEYEGNLQPSDIEALKTKLESKVNELKDKSLPVDIKFLENDPKKRIIIIDNFEPIFCGGTHVRNSSEVGQIIIRKIKNEKANLRVSYEIS